MYALALGRCQLRHCRLVFFRRDVLGDVAHFSEFVLVEQIPNRLSSSIRLENVKNIVRR